MGKLLKAKQINSTFFNVRNFFVFPGLLCVLRYYSNNSASVKVDKSILSELRKRTGYGFSKCLDALKLNKNDINEAEKWLAEQAQKEGWMKAEKLKERTMSQGLIGASVEGNIAAMVEVSLYVYPLVMTLQTFIDYL